MMHYANENKTDLTLHTYFLWSFLQQDPCPSYDAKLAKASQNSTE